MNSTDGHILHTAPLKGYCRALAEVCDLLSAILVSFFFFFFLLLSLSFLLPVTHANYRADPRVGVWFFETRSRSWLTACRASSPPTNKKTHKACFFFFFCILHIFLRERVKSLHLFDKYVKTSLFQHWCGERGRARERGSVVLNSACFNVTSI